MAEYTVRWTDPSDGKTFVSKVTASSCVSVVETLDSVGLTPLSIEAESEVVGWGSRVLWAIGTLGFFGLLMVVLVSGLGTVLSPTYDALVVIASVLAGALVGIVYRRRNRARLTTFVIPSDDVNVASALKSRSTRSEPFPQWAEAFFAIGLVSAIVHATHSLVHANDATWGVVRSVCLAMLLCLGALLSNKRNEAL